MPAREIVNPALEDYLHRSLPPRHPVLEEMERIARERGFPIVGPAVGELLELLARSVGAHRVFEMGSGFGYSTLWFARAVGAEGTVVHTEGDAANSDLARDLLEQAGLAARVRFLVGDARELLAAEQGPFDVIFCDIDKHQYPGVPDLALPRLRRGGLLVVDNMLWKGQVVDADDDANTQGVLELTRLLRGREDLQTTILPLRDGVSVSLKL
jgi:predicted O-methyltransferase YrrM